MNRVCSSVVVSLLLMLMGGACWSHEEHDEESATAFELAQWGPIGLMRGQDQLVAIAADQLVSGKPTDRQRAAFILGQIGTDGALAALIGALDDSDRLVRMHAAVALTQSGRAEGHAGAKAAFHEGPEWLKYHAIYGMYRTDAARCLTLLEQQPLSGSPFLSRIVATARRYPPSEWPEGPFYVEPLQADNWDQLLERAAVALTDEADIWFHGGDYDQAIRCNEAAVFLQPSWVEVYAASGWLLWSMNRHGAAVQTYRRAIEANPEDWEAYFELGYYYLLQGQPGPALRHLQRSVELDAPPVRARSYAHALERNGRLAEALGFWRELEKVDSSGVVTSNIRRLEEILGAGGDG